jgi:RNA polymerase sigma factor (sigma-70 family)
MATSPMSMVFQHLRTTELLSDGARMTDGDLLERFIAGRDEAAFVALVRRHGQMVWGVCRRVLVRHQDAEDAFQATFLVLVRKATSVVPREMVGNWLYGVAHQTALNARANEARKRTRERQVTQMPEPADREQELWRDLQSVLDQELSRLPNKYRAAIALCDLGGKTRKEVAQQLGVPEGTVSGWLTRGRAMLAKRLARQGLALSAAALAAALSQNMSSAGTVPAAVVSNTINAARLLAAGQVAATGVISAQVAALTEGVIKTMLLTKLKLASAVLLVFCAAGMGATDLIYHAPQAAEPTERPGPPAQAHAGKKPAGNDARRPEATSQASRQGTPAPSFTLSKETTYITGPLDKDGYVDFETALNDRLGKNITPEKNANALLWQALGPVLDGRPVLPEFFRLLKVPAPPERGEYFVGVGQYATGELKLKPGEQIRELYGQRNWAAQRPWVAQDYPQIAAWLKANEKPLAVVSNATKLPEYYHPLVSAKSGDEGWYGLLGARVPAGRKYAELANALAARAMLHAGAGRFDEAWRDLLACHRLGRLLMRGADHGEFLAGAGMDQVASTAELALLDRANPTAKQAQVWLRDLQQLPPIPPSADKLDPDIRLTFLNTTMLVRRDPIKTLNLLAVLSGRPRPLPRGENPEAQPALVDAADWDALLRDGNVWYDRLVAAHRMKDRAAREKEIDRIEAEVKALEKDTGAPAAVVELLRKGKAPGKEMSKKLEFFLRDYFLMLIRQLRQAADQIEQAQRNLHLAFALAAYRGEHEGYPEKLDALVPKYLEEVPTDLYSGKALIYRPSEGGYLLYSVGVNGKDEQGRGHYDTPPGDDRSVRMPQQTLKRK